MNRYKLAKKIFEISNIKGNFKLRSGQYSNEYFDKYLFEANPDILNAIALEALKLLPKGIELLAGLEMGGIPIATMISHHSKIPTLFIRKKAKDYGTCKLVEGGEVNDKNILIIEDVVSTGGAIIDAVNDLRKIGAIVNDVICVIDRESGGKEKLEAVDLNLISIFKKSELEN
jgi:orotate phosphoribosyltransferase